MRWSPAALAALVLLSGCTSVSVDSSSDSYAREANGERYAMECSDGECEFCMQDACVPCSEEECRECVDREGYCDAVAPGTAVVPDYDWQETADLAQGYPETSFDFDVAPGATGHVTILIRDPAAQQATVMASACFRYTITGPWGSSSGSENMGNCGGTGVSGSTSGGPKVVASWDGLQDGRYSLVLEAPPQANQMSIDIHVDNP